jgi:hypothetical protein
MEKLIYLEWEFGILVIFSFAVPTAMLVGMMRKRVFSRLTLIILGHVLVLLAGIDAICLQRLASKAKLSAGLVDDTVFTSEISIALYIIPMILAGIGINVVSHVLCGHLTIVELKERQD